MLSPPPETNQKKLGAYYTEARVARFLIQWSIRSNYDTLLDPSFGGGIFLKSALQHFNDLGVAARNQVFGIEIDEAAHSQVAKKLSQDFQLPKHQVIHSDFFELSPDHLPLMDCIVGNPPFVRHHSLAPKTLSKALEKTRLQEVNLNRRANLWAPFVVHSCALLKPGGRIAMILPIEFGHATYAKPVLSYLHRNFKYIHLLTFKEPLFPKLNQEVLILLAEDKAKTSATWHINDYATLDELSPNFQKAQMIEFPDLLDHRPLHFYSLPTETQALYKTLSTRGDTQNLGAIAEVGIGYVTGANAYFHLSKQEAKDHNISMAYLSPSVYRGRALDGLRLDKKRWEDAEKLGHAGYVLHIRKGQKLSKHIKAYLDYGQTLGIHQTYKSRHRRPWYVVPGIIKADGFLSYMSGHRPQLVMNEANVTAANSLHVLSLKAHSPSMADLAVLWQTSLTSLSLELEGHALGGGLLKLEPTEAKRVLILQNATIPEHLHNRIHALLQTHQEETARDLADEYLLKPLVPNSVYLALKEAAFNLQKRRLI